MSAPASDSQLRVVVTGLIGSIPLAGLTLHYLQYPLGFRALGHDVLYLEDTGSWYYDRETDSLWYPYDNGLMGIQGVYFERWLPKLPSDDTRWQEWKAKHPHSKIID